MNRDPVRIGFLHPGEMGTALAKVVQRNGAITLWASEARSDRTVSRATAASIEDVGTLQALCSKCEIIVSICPPHAALEMAEAVAACEFGGIYVDANAISPNTAVQIAEIVSQAGATFVDAAVMGPPPNGRINTILCFSGDAAQSVAQFFKADALVVELLGSSRSKASALKMCHSAIHKGQLAMLLTTLASAEHFGVRSQFENLLTLSAGTRALVNELPQIPTRAAKSWRFIGEMLEVADTFAAAGLPPDMHRGACEIFRRCAEQKVGQNALSTDDLIRMLRNHGIQSE